MAIFLLINSIGYTVYAHYCNDELKETSILSKAKSCCEEEPESTKTSKDVPMSCCAEKDVLVVIKDQFVKSELSFQALSQPVLFINNTFTLLFSSIQLPVVANISPLYIKDLGPPSVRLNVLYSVFRI